MKTATVGDLRNNYSKVETWLSDGELVRIERRGEPVALLTPLPKEKSAAVKAPGRNGGVVWRPRPTSDRISGAGRGPRE